MAVTHQDVWRGFATIARYYGIAVNIPALQEQFATDELHEISVQFVRAVRQTGLKCRHFRRFQVKGKIVLPALVELPDIGHVILLAVRGDEWLIQRDGASSESFIPEPNVRYSGFLFARRFSLERLSSEFNLRWFADAFWRYKKLIGEVLLASFFIQLLALVTPLFFQVVVDKVLTHQSLTTLDVLALGMLFVSLFDVILDGLRSYQLAHTSQRIDATLSSLLYRHLLALPLNWFLQRQTGVIVARVHELKTVREFLTGSAMTLCLDLLFTLVFFRSWRFTACR
ncbi:hypothetical protein FHC49_00090 [Kluyvera sp. EC_51]|uniref:ABC transporter transmembrane domain-containing protein n=1 Tax=Kluyvera sp. EC_51 TaxID=2584089 RepID=UPI001C703D3F|nr:ABC transporter transmembrane domain-containing protein [Kluyvera sp. EC_51]MBW9459827.1 hypothetical protein [Kluyvera sp. EC_51]